MHAKRGGFTLIEMLVVLIITALVSGVLFQALERSYALQRRFGTELFKVQQGQMAVDWYRQTVQGLYPEQPNGSDLFHGDGATFSGLSTNALSDDFGTPAAIQWSLVASQPAGRVDLVYREPRRRHHDQKLARRRSKICLLRRTADRARYLAARAGFVSPVAPSGTARNPRQRRTRRDRCLADGAD